MRKIYFGLASLLVVALASGLLVFAADHSEAPGTQADVPADIADLYAWHDSDAGTLTAVLTYAGLQATPADYDADVLYTVKIDNNGDNAEDINVYVRFGKNEAGEWGVQVENLPGADGTVTGAVETTLDGGNDTKVYAGLRDDPFFFDLEGFNETFATGTLAISSERDSVAGANVASIVLEMNLDAAKGSGDSLQVWATTGRK